MSADLAARDGLTVSGGHHSLGKYLRVLWKRRAYLWHVPRNELAAKHANMALGNLWNLLNPVLLIAFYFLIFGVVLDVNRGSDNYITFLAVGIFVFQFSNRTVTSGSSSIISNTGLIRAIQFPRALLPLSAAVRQLMQHWPAIVLMLCTALVTGESPKLAWLLLPFAVLLQFGFNCGLALVFARATHSVPDIQNVIPFIFRFLFYGSGVLFTLDRRIPDQWLWLFEYNPFYCIIAIHRGIVFATPIPSLLVFNAVVWTLLLTIGGMVWFHRDEAFYGAKN